MPERRPKQKLFFTLKLIVGVALLVFIITWQGNGEKVLELFKNIRIDQLGLLLLMVFLLNLVSCLKWQLFLREYGAEVSIFRLLGLYCIGKFFNNFFPSTVGGDIARSYMLGRQIQSQGRSFASVILERATGLVALILLACSALLLNPGLVQEPLIAISLVGILGLGGFMVLILLNPRLPRKISTLLGGIGVLSGLSRKCNLLLAEIQFMRGKNLLLLKSMLYSVVFHSMTIIQVYLACQAIGFSPRFLDIAVITPIVLMITSIPLTPNKLGVWEWAFGIFFLQAGGQIVEGVGVALLIRGLGLLVSILGGLLLIGDRASVQRD